ncbi:hypothetical protein P9578_18285 [Brevibacillus choshinensis]|nr:hypothetical protein [Brevibacillus choshinensis]
MNRRGRAQSQLLVRVKQPLLQLLDSHAFQHVGMVMDGMMPHDATRK